MIHFAVLGARLAVVVALLLVALALAARDLAHDSSLESPEYTGGFKFVCSSHRSCLVHYSDVPSDTRGHIFRLSRFYLCTFVLYGY